MSKPQNPVQMAVIGAAHGIKGELRVKTFTGEPMALADYGLLAISAALVAIGHFLIVIAFRDADVAAIAPFRYSLLLWAGICGYVAFGEIPDRFAIFGSILIVGSGLYALHREVVRRRSIAAAVPPAEPGA